MCVFNAIITLVLLLATSLAAAAGQPNVILIMADDIGYECFGCYGSNQYKTPHLDRLADQGVRFTQAYSQPLCTPSRVKIMTGLSNARNYSAFSILNRDQRTIGQLFQQAGYATAVAGKWQLYGSAGYPKWSRAKGTLPSEAGFDRVCLWQIGQRGKRYWSPLLEIDGKIKQFESNTYGPDVCTDYLIDFIQEQAAVRPDQPFFAYYPMMLVHDPFLTTPDRASQNERDHQQNFEEMVVYMDKLVGRIVAKVKALGLAEETLILFTGDNGTHPRITSHLDGIDITGGKRLTTDAGTRVPLIASWPGVAAEGRVCEELVDFSDFLPTCLAAANIDAPGEIDGVSFLSQIRGESGPVREWIYEYYCPRPEKTPPIRFARDQRWKLYGDGRFYNMTNDVLEQYPIPSADLSPDAAAARAKLGKALASMPAVGETLLQFPGIEPDPATPKPLGR